MEEETERKKLVVFGKDLSEIPCFRNSWLYGISGGIGSGLLYFLFTSKPKMATHVGFASIMGITGIYWVVCRYDYEQKTRELEKMKVYLEKRILMEGTAMEKVFEADMVNVSQRNDKSV